MNHEERMARITQLNEQQRLISAEIYYLQALETDERRDQLAREYQIFYDTPLKMTERFLSSINRTNDMRLAVKYKDELYLDSMGLMREMPPGFYINVRIGPIEKDGSKYLIENVEWDVIKGMME